VNQWAWVLSTILWALTEHTWTQRCPWSSSLQTRLRATIVKLTPISKRALTSRLALQIELRDLYSLKIWTSWAIEDHQLFKVKAFRVAHSFWGARQSKTPARSTRMLLTQLTILITAFYLLTKMMLMKKWPLWSLKREDNSLCSKAVSKDLLKAKTVNRESNWMLLEYLEWLSPRKAPSC
jgi:hypothetical protein